MDALITGHYCAGKSPPHLCKHLCLCFVSLQVHNESDFLEKLGCGDVAGVKVISIFGNTGDGKSHTLNNILFGGEDVFYTSKSPSSCTVGVWAAYDPNLSLIALDTEGLLGAATTQNQRMRLLLKVMLAGHWLVEQHSNSQKLRGFHHLCLSRYWQYLI